MFYLRFSISFLAVYFMTVFCWCFGSGIFPTKRNDFGSHVMTHFLLFKYWRESAVFLEKSIFGFLLYAIPCMQLSVVVTDRSEGFTNLLLNN